MQVTPDISNLSLKVYLEYPTTFFRIQTLHKGAFIQFCEDSLAALAFLEQSGTMHGNLRPEMFFWSSNGQIFRLLDNFLENLTFAEIHHQNVSQRQPIFMAPRRDAGRHWGTPPSRLPSYPPKTISLLSA